MVHAFLIIEVLLKRSSVINSIVFFDLVHDECY